MSFSVVKGIIEENLNGTGLKLPTLLRMGMLKDEVYAHRQSLIQGFKCGIYEAIKGIQQSLCDPVMENSIKRLRFYEGSRGGHLADFVFNY